MDVFVVRFVSKTDGLISTVAETGFASVLQAVNGIAAASATLAICLLVLNQFLQFKYISVEQFFALFIKLILVAYIGFQWGNIGSIAHAIQSGMDSIADKLLSLSTLSPRNTVAGIIDELIQVLSVKNNIIHASYDLATTQTFSIINTLILSLLGCLGALIIIYCKMMFSLYMCLAPLFIICFIFEATKDYFFRWLKGAITYTLYPVITAALIGMTYMAIMAYINSLTASDLINIKTFNPFIAIAIMMILVIFSIPFIVSGLSGMIQNVFPVQIMSQLEKLTSWQTIPSNGASNWQPHPLHSQPMQSQPSQSSHTEPTVTQPSGPFPGEPSRMLAREIRIHGDRSKPST